jgi:hypothetical protein
MALFPTSGVLRGFPSAAYNAYASMKTQSEIVDRKSQISSLHYSMALANPKSLKFAPRMAGVFYDSTAPIVSGRVNGVSV